MELIQGEKFKTLHNGENIFYCNTHDVNNFFDNINFDNDFILISSACVRGAVSTTS